MARKKKPVKPETRFLGNITGCGYEWIGDGQLAVSSSVMSPARAAMEEQIGLRATVNAVIDHARKRETAIQIEIDKFFEAVREDIAGHIDGYVLDPMEISRKGVITLTKQAATKEQPSV